MKKLILIVFLCFSVNTFAQIGNLYIYNFSSLDVQYQLGADNTNGDDCYPSYGFFVDEMPSSAGFTIAAGTQHVYTGFEFPTANFPAPPAGEEWKYERKMASGTLPITTSVANAQLLSGNPPSGNPSSPYQARWKYFKWVVDATQFGGLRLASDCSASSPINETDDLILYMMPFGDDTIITIDNN